jgi:hypothetical protein
MAVYVDHLLPCIPTEKWPFRFSCHLVADGNIEIDSFARRLGLKREWWQGHKGKLVHYDLTASKRKLALKLGAQEIDGKELVRRFMRNRSGIGDA